MKILITSLALAVAMFMFGGCTSKHYYAGPKQPTHKVGHPSGPHGKKPAPAPKANKPHKR